MIRIGILGCGFMGGMHAACYQALASQNVKVCGVNDSRLDFAQTLAEKYGAVLFETPEAMLQSGDIDVIDICLPVDLHTKYAVAAMRAGKHVFIEKPVCLTEEEMSLLLQTEKETGVKVQVGQVIRHWKEYVWLKNVVEAGTYGRVLSAQFQRLSARPTWAGADWVHQVQRSGGVAVEMHVHDVDFVRWLLGEPDTIQSQASRDRHDEIQHITSLYGYGTDVSVMLEAGWDFPATFPFTAQYMVRMEKATVWCKDNVLTVYPEDGEPFRPALADACTDVENAGGNISDLGGYFNELKYFVEGLYGQNDLSVAPLQSAISSVRLAWREAAAAGGLIMK